MAGETYSVQPGQQFTAILGGMPNEVGALPPNYLPPNLPAGTVGVQVVPLAGGGAVIARLTTPREQAPNSGIYAAPLTGPPLTGSYTLLWDANGGNPPFLSQTLQVGTAITPGSSSAIAGDGITEQTPIYLTPCVPGEPATNPDLEANINGLVIDDPVAMDALIVECEWEIDSILGTHLRDPATGRKINPNMIIPVEQWYYQSNYLFSPFMKGVSIYQLHGLRRAVAAQVEYHLKMGEDYFVKPRYNRVSGPQFSYDHGGAPMDRIASKARMHLAGTGLIRNGARLS